MILESTPRGANTLLYRVSKVLEFYEKSEVDKIFTTKNKVDQIRVDLSSLIQNQVFWPNNMGLWS